MSAETRPARAVDTMTATRRIPASPDAVFAVLADPRTHADIHGTGRESDALDDRDIGRVDEAVDTAPIVGVGQRFRMAMYHEQHPDKNYQTVNEILVFEPPSAIAWRTGYLDDDGAAHFGGWLWRYDLTTTGGHDTEVTLTYDWSAATPEARNVIDFPPFGPDHLHDSLAHLAGVVSEHEE
jgi:uncharacterized protein YndB with AHSA1/START domain